MIYRRDLLLGLTVLAVLFGIILISLLALVSVKPGGLHVAGDCVAVIEVTGAIVSPDNVVRKLERYIRNDDVRAIVIRLNTPGGGISATQEIHQTVLKARFAGKLIVASMGSVAASGGYYIAAACDSIMATPGTVTGSIGVIMSLTEFSDLFEKLGITFNVMKSGKFKDTGSIARKMTDEERSYLDDVIMDFYEQFVEVVSEGRSMDPEYVRTYADGRIMTGRQALELGFVDLLGTYQDAIDLAGDMAGLGIDPPVLKEADGSLMDILINGVSRIVVRGVEQAVPRIAYLWTM